MYNYLYIELKTHNKPLLSKEFNVDICLDNLLLIMLSIEQLCEKHETI